MVGVGTDLLGHGAALVKDANSREDSETGHVAPVIRVDIGDCAGL